MKKQSLQYFCSFVLLCIFSIVVIYFSYQSFYSVVFELDSKFISIPIANKIIDLSIFNPDSFSSYWFYYPASTEVILALFKIFSINVGLFNVLSYLLLFITLIILGKYSRLNIYESIIFSASTLLIPAYFRWIPTLKNDIYLVLFFTLVLVIVLKFKNSWKYFIALGIATGMIIGTKHFGIIYLVSIGIVYKNNLILIIKNKKIVLSTILFFITGLTWYIRNIIYTSNPLYPFSFPFLNGTIDYRDSSILTIFIQNKNAIVTFINALITDFPTTFLIFIAIYIYIKYKKQFTPVFILENNKLLLLSLLNCSLFILYPGTAENFSSSMRYLYPTYIPLSLFMFKTLITSKRKLIAYSLSIVIASYSLSLINFHPKILFIALCSTYCLYFIILKRINHTKQSSVSL